MGVELVESADLFVKDGAVLMRTTAGPCKVDVIYRRVDDAFLDPLAFRPDSMLGVPGLLSVYRSGNVVLANAIGTGVADDKSIYPYVPEMIRYYLDEDPILNNVPTAVPQAAGSELRAGQSGADGGERGARCRRLRHVDWPGRQPAAAERVSRTALARPDNYIAQDTLSLSTCPTFIDNGLAPRHIDLRPLRCTARISGWCRAA